MRYSLLATQLYGQPLLLQAEKAAVIEAVLCRHEQGEKVDAVSADKQELSPHAAAYAASRFSDKPYAVTDAGVAVIPITGTLVYRGSQLDSMSGLTSYSLIEKLANTAAADADVKGILFDLSTPGGQADGVFDLGTSIRAIQKPKIAVANSLALSAGYALAAAADKVIVTSTGRVGSIGVIALHVDQSQKNAKAGLAYTAIHAGAKKNHGTPHAPLAEPARADMQATVDGLYTQFVDYVSQMRGISADAVRAQEAGVYSGQQAVDAGLADAVMSFNDSLAEFEAQVSKPAGFTNGGSRQFKGVIAMTTEAKAAATISAEQLAAQTAKETLEARNAGATEMQARIKSIQTCDEAKGREKLAAHLAFNTAMNADDAKALLAAAPQETAQAVATNALSAGMAAVTNPQVGAGAAQEPEQTQAQASSLWERSNKKLHVVK
jgi:signal peptide peptidase SppA